MVGVTNYEFPGFVVSKTILSTFPLDGYVSQLRNPLAGFYWRGNMRSSNVIKVGTEAKIDNNVFGNDEV